ncbi:MAG TPA: hypothetical protein QF658_00210, partial [Pelagibacteraceae bacterium]|nr:hypothetical protein [Pelagibacteraceae bacterium]
EERRLEEKREELKAERLARKQQERTVLLEEKENKIHEKQNLPKQELVSRLDDFQTKHSKKN